MTIRPIKKYDKILAVPGDKSITHRAVMFGALAEGVTTIGNALFGADCLSTIDCMCRLGVSIDIKEERRSHCEELATKQSHGPNIIIIGGLKFGKEKIKLDVGNSGTTIRLLAGVLAGIDGLHIEISGDESIARRPMKRVVEPLRLMGADIECLGGDGLAPLIIRGKKLKGIDYVMPVASAQVKSAILLAGLNADGETIVRESVVSRNHTEIMLRSMKCNCESRATKQSHIVTVKRSGLKALDITVPGDISSAAFPAVLAAVRGRVVLKNIGVNPTRGGILDILKAAGIKVNCGLSVIARSEATKQSYSSLASHNDESGEPIADIIIEKASLKPFALQGDIIPRLIDEIPVLAVLACFAKGKSIIKDAAELKVKESNRIDTVAKMINALGGNATATLDGMIIDGKGYLEGGTIDAKGDHRIAMSGAVALALSKNGGELVGGECADVSYPDFFKTVL